MENNYNNYNNYNNDYNSDDNNRYNPYSTYQGYSQQHEQTTGQQNSYQQAAYQQASQEPRKKKGAFAGFGVTLIKTVTIALVFGLVSGAAGTAVLQFSDVSLGVFEDKDKQEEEKAENEDKEDADIVEDEEDDVEIEHPLQQTDTDVAIGTVMDVSDIVENAMPSVVAISNTGEITYQSIWGQTFTQESESAGTGFLVKQDNQYIYIATNNHVVVDATKLEVQFCDGAIVEAEIKGLGSY